MSGRTSSTFETSSWWTKLVTIAIITNALLVILNILYVPCRDFCINHFPLLTYYDLVKGIEPHPQTQAYIDAVNQLSDVVSSQGLSGSEVQSLLSDLRNQSSNLIDEDPFITAGKSVAFARVKQLMSHHVGQLSVRDAFRSFWSLEYLQQVGWDPALVFFRAKVQPLLDANYFRPVDQMGQFVDRFWMIDLPFCSLFLADFLRRTFTLCQQNQNVSWWDAVLRRWYDTLLFIPAWRWLRGIPLLVHVHQSGLVNFKRILAQLTYEPAAYLADRTSSFLVVRLFNQAEETIHGGDLLQHLQNPEERAEEASELQKLVDYLTRATVYQVIPTIQPEVTSILKHSLEESFRQNVLYQGVARIPMLESWPSETLEQLAQYLATSAATVITETYSDAEGRILLDQLAEQFRQALYQELEQEDTQQQVRRASLELLQAFKSNFVQKSATSQPEATLDEADQLVDQSLSQQLSELQGS